MTTVALNLKGQKDTFSVVLGFQLFNSTIMSLFIIVDNCSGTSLHNVQTRSLVSKASSPSSGIRRLERSEDSFNIMFGQNSSLRVSIHKCYHRLMQRTICSGGCQYTSASIIVPFRDVTDSMISIICITIIMAYTQNTYGTNTYRYSFRR